MKNRENYMTADDLRSRGLLGAPKGAGHHFKAYLQRLGKTAADASRDLDVAKSTVTRLINGDSELTVEMGTKIQRAYGLPVKVLFRMDAEHKAYAVSQNLSQSAA